MYLVHRENVVVGDTLFFFP